MSIAERKKHYTYADYATWDDDIRCELIDGIIYDMAAPSRIHQEISMALSATLWNFLQGKSCRVFTAPFDVRLNADTKDDIVIQPDILVVCDEKKLNDKHCIGAPDFIIEILSPSTSKKDLWLKFNRYHEAKVKEYWIVDPDNRLVNKMVLTGDRYTTQIFGDEDKVPVSILEGCIIDMKEIFP